MVVWNEMKVTNSFTLETSMFCKTEIVPVSSADEAPNTEQKMKYIQLQLSDLHQIAKSFLLSSAQYSKLEKELEKEWKLSVGWFKPSKLNEVTGEAMRDKQRRELTQKKPTKESRKELPLQQQPGVLATNRKRLERMNSSSIAAEGPLRRKVSKLSSNTRVTEKSTTKDSILPVDKKKPSKRQQSQTNVHLVAGTQSFQSPSQFKPKGPDSQGPMEEETSQQEDQAKPGKKPKGPKIKSITQEEPSTIEVSGSQPVVIRLKSWKEFFDLEEFKNGIISI